MRLRHAILSMSALAVVGDAVLIAFYPPFFAQRYGLESAVHVGAYIAAISVAVMCTLPLWARVARRVDTLRLLAWTQCAAGVLCLASGWADSVAAYWVLSLLMFMCRSSYLLMFPLLMRTEPPAVHATLIGLLSVLVHLGGIFGAAVGGWVLQRYGASACLWLMAATDFAQMALCAGLRRSGMSCAAAPAASPAGRRACAVPVLQLGLVMLVFDFSAYLVRPFFSVYWQEVSGSTPTVAGLAFAIPGIVALVALAANRRAQQRGVGALDHTLANLLLGAAGLLLQAAPSTPCIVLGRCLFGWALFQVVVKLETSLFRISTPQAYAGHYSIANFFQNLGVLLSSFAAGALVARFGIAITFAVAAAGFAVTALLDRLTVRVDRLPRLDLPGATPHAT
jgi:DHA1 family multidrug resistance protein-like MFS transporter